MTEAQEIAQSLLPSYLPWLSASLNRNNTMDCARYFVKSDPILRTESPQHIDNIARALRDLAA